MSFNLSNLSSFKLEDSGILIQKAVLGADLFQFVDVRPGYPEASVSINVLDLTQGFTGAACGWDDAAGSANFTQVDVDNLTYNWKLSLCLEDLRDYWVSTQLAPSASGEVLPFEDQISDLMVAETKKFAEGIVAEQLISDVTVSNGAEAGPTAAWTSSTAYGLAIQMIDALPLDVANRTDLTMFMSYAYFRYLQTDIVSKNLFHYATGQTTGTGLGQSIVIPGTNVRAIPVGGWGTSQRVIVGPAKHIIVTCGLVNDTDVIKAWWSEDNQEMRLLSKFTIGSNAIISEFATNDLA